MKRDAFRDFGAWRNHDAPTFQRADPRWAVDVRGRPRGPAPPHGATQQQIDELRAKIDPSSPDFALFLKLTQPQSE